MSALHIAAWKGNFQIVKLIIRTFVSGGLGLVVLCALSSKYTQAVGLGLLVWMGIIVRSYMNGWLGSDSVGVHTAENNLAGQAYCCVQSIQG
jgi:hypothetical protein